MKNKLLNLLNRGNERSQKAKKNILAMLFIKGGSILIGLLLVPLTLHYVDSETYGIWITLSSMIAWISFFDIGVNNGLKNKLTRALALKNYELGRRYVSTTYAILCLIFIPLMCILLIASQFVNWCSLLNLSQKYSESLSNSVMIIIVYFCLNFILSTINVVILAEQRPADESLRSLCQQIVSLAIIFILIHTTKGSLVYLCLALCFAPLIVVCIFNFTLFRGRFRCVAPSLRCIDFSLAPGLFKLGFQFFVIQIASIIQYQMINFLILRNYGASDVTSYNIATKYFNVIMMVWGIMTTPIWVAVTDAIAKKDYDWIRRIRTKFLKLFFIGAVGGVLMLACSHWVYLLWVGGEIVIPLALSFWVLIYNLVQMFGNLHVSIINGSGELKIQFYSSLMSPLVFLAMVYLLVHELHWGIYAILIAAIVSNYNGLLLAPLQCQRLLRKNG